MEPGPCAGVVDVDEPLLEVQTLHPVPRVRAGERAKQDRLKVGSVDAVVRRSTALVVVSTREHPTDHVAGASGAEDQTVHVGRRRGERFGEVEPRLKVAHRIG
nr:hypothetical protein [Streptomyces sp. MK5]